MTLAHPKLKSWRMPGVRACPHNEAVSVFIFSGWTWRACVTYMKNYGNLKYKKDNKAGHALDLFF